MTEKSPPTHEQSARKRASKVAQTRLAEGARTIQADVVSGTKRKPGQPTKFTQPLWDEIIDRIACYENIIDICDDARMPSYMTVRGWYRTNPELKAQIEEAWVDASYLGHFVNDNILRQGSRSTGDFRRDEAIVANNRWFMGKTSRRLFGDKQTVDLNSTINIAIPDWVTPTKVVVEDGEIIDPDLVYEQATVARLTGPVEPEGSQQAPQSFCEDQDTPAG